MIYEQAAETALKSALAAASLDGTDADGNAYEVALRCSLIDDDPDAIRDEVVFPVVGLASEIAYSEEEDGRCPWVVPVSFALATINATDTKKQTIVAIYEKVRDAIEKVQASDWTAHNPSGYSVDAVIVQQGGEISTSDEGTRLNLFEFIADVHITRES